jgi:hypothetical protein
MIKTTIYVISPALKAQFTLPKIVKTPNILFISNMYILKLYVYLLKCNDHFVHLLWIFQ